MTDRQWLEMSPYFSKRDNFGRHSMMVWHHVHHLWLIRDTMANRWGCNWPMVVLDGNGKTHSATGQHPLGLATDFYFDTKMCSRGQFDILMSALEGLNLAEFMGLGVYIKCGRDYEGELLPVWFHLDSRGSHPARWGKVGVGHNEDGSIKKADIDFRQLDQYLER